MISDKTSLNMDQMNLITFGMSAVSLVGAVIQLAMISSTTAEDIYRSYLGKVASCHFSLVSSEMSCEQIYHAPQKMHVLLKILSKCQLMKKSNVSSLCNML